MIEVIKATQKEVNSIVVIHQQAFPDFFLTSLGERFLRLYYRCMCKSEKALTLCAIEDGEVVGFASTALKSEGFNTKLIKSNIMRFSVEAFRLLLARPMSLVRLVKNFTKKSSDMEDNGDYAELFSIGVSPLCQGKGVGSLLLSENERMVREWGGGKMLIAYYR